MSKTPSSLLWMRAAFLRTFGCELEGVLALEVDWGFMASEFWASLGCLLPCLGAGFGV